MGFFPKKRMKEIFAYILKFTLTFDKMQNTSPTFEIEHFESYSSFSYCMHSSVYWVF